MEIENLKPCPFCEGKNIEVKLVNVKGIQYFYAAVCCKCGARGGRHNSKIKAAEAWNTRAANALFLPARVGDSILVKDGDSTETLRIDGFELRGDELMVWSEGENERYVEFSQYEIIKYIPKEDNHEKRSN